MNGRYKLPVANLVTVGFLTVTLMRYLDCTWAVTATTCVAAMAIYGAYHWGRYGEHGEHPSSPDTRILPPDESN